MYNLRCITRCRFLMLKTERLYIELINIDQCESNVTNELGCHWLRQCGRACSGAYHGSVRRPPTLAEPVTRKRTTFPVHQSIGIRNSGLSRGMNKILA